VGAPVIGTAASHQLLLLLTQAGVMEKQELLPLLEQHPDEFLGDVLVREGLLLEDYLQGLLARLLHLPCVMADGCAESAARRIATLLPESFCREHRVMAVSRTRHFLTLAAANPLDAPAMEEARAITGLEVRLVLCSARPLMKLTDAVYRAPDWEGDAPAEPPEVAKP
jgi:type IV pilus assembly protein PilB